MTKCLWQRGHRVPAGEHGEDSELWLVSILALPLTGAPQVELVAKNPPANTGDIRDAGSIPGSGRSPGEGNGNPLWYSYLKNLMDRGAWQAALDKFTKSQTGLK